MSLDILTLDWFRILVLALVLQVCPTVLSCNSCGTKGLIIPESSAKYYNLKSNIHGLAQNIQHGKYLCLDFGFTLIDICLYLLHQHAQFWVSLVVLVHVHWQLQ